MQQFMLSNMFAWSGLDFIRRIGKFLVISTIKTIESSETAVTFLKARDFTEMSMLSGPKLTRSEQINWGKCVAKRIAFDTSPAVFHVNVTDFSQIVPKLLSRNGLPL